MSLIPALHQVAGRRDLNAADAQAAMQTILAGESSPPQIAAFLVALRMKGESVSELVGFARAMRQAGMLKRLGGAYLRVWWRLNRPLGRDAIPFHVFVGMCVIHWHFFNIAQRPRDVTFGNVAPTVESAAA